MVTKTNETTLITEVRKAALSTIDGENRRAKALIAMGGMSLDGPLGGMPQGHLVETKDVTLFLKGSVDEGITGFVVSLGFTGWAEMDPITKINSTMQDVLREVTFCVCAGFTFDWWTDAGGKKSDHPVITKDNTIYVKTSVFPGMQDENMPYKDVSFAKIYSAARKKLAKPSGDGGKVDAAAFRRLFAVVLNTDGVIDMEHLTSEATLLIPELYETATELMQQFDDAGHSRRKETDVSAVA
jgi:hypothetical protein